MLRLVAENAALEDGLYYLDLGVTDSAISVEVFLKEIRRLARKQFVARATMKKVIGRPPPPYAQLRIERADVTPAPAPAPALAPAPIPPYLCICSFVKHRALHRRAKSRREKPPRSSVGRPRAFYLFILFIFLRFFVHFSVCNRLVFPFSPCLALFFFIALSI